MIVKEYTCKVCGKQYTYECGGEAGYARDLCSPYCGGLHSGWNSAIAAALAVISESSSTGCYKAVEDLER